MTNILAKLRAGLNQAWVALGDAKTAIAYVSITQGSLTPTTITLINAGLVDYKAGTRPGSDIRAGDRRAIIRASDLPARPKSGDLIQADGTTWTVVAVQGDPRVFYDLQLRQ
jgi:hypothetical protein